MPTLSKPEKAFLMKLYYTSGESVAVACRRYHTAKGIKNKACQLKESTVRGIVKRFETFGQFDALPRSGRPTSVDDYDMVINQMLLEDGEAKRNSSVRNLAERISLSKSSVRKILRLRLKKFPYKITTDFLLLESDFGRRRDFCNIMLAKGEAFLRTVLWSDESHFYLNGVVNRQNVRFWADEKPEEIFEVPLHSEKVTVWAAFSCNFRAPLYFFAESVNSERYVELIQRHLVPWLQSNRRQRTTVFQHDGARPHVANASINAIKSSFPAGVIGQRYGMIEWPARSPDLTPVDYFLWGYMKAKVYEEPRPATLSELQAKICTVYASIPQDMLERAVLSVATRARLCLLQEGKHLSN